MENADRLVVRTLQIIDYFQQKFWWIENPRNGMLRNRPFMQGIPFIDVDYCQFSGWGYQKPTRIWGHARIKGLPNKLCDGKTCENLITTWKGTLGHRQVLGGKSMQYSQRSKGKVPEALVEYLLSTIPEISGVQMSDMDECGKNECQVDEIGGNGGEVKISDCMLE